jgi:hypothetical protein
MANAATFTGGANTWTTDHVLNIALTPVFENSDIFTEDTYMVDPTVNKSKTFPKLGNMSRILQKGTSCGISTNGQAVLGEVELETQPVNISLEQCSHEFDDSVFKRLMKKGSDRDDLIDTAMWTSIVDRAGTTLTNDLYELCWFGDTASGTTFFQTFNGWFKLIESNCSSPVQVSTTAGDLPADAALSILRSVHKNKNTMRSIPRQDKVFLVTDSIYCNLLETYENKDLDDGLTRIENGPEGLAFRGIEIRPQITWDATIADQSLANPHRVIYTKKENLMVGTDVAIAGSDARVWFDPKEELTYYKAAFDLGVQIMFCEDLVYAR